MQQVREAVGVEKVLRVVRAANLTGPSQQLSTGANPEAAFSPEQERGGWKDRGKGEPQPESVFVCSRQ